MGHRSVPWHVGAGFTWFSSQRSRLWLHPNWLDFSLTLSVCVLYLLSELKRCPVTLFLVTDSFAKCVICWVPLESLARVLALVSLWLVFVQRCLLGGEEQQTPDFSSSTGPRLSSLSLLRTGLCASVQPLSSPSLCVAWSQDRRCKWLDSSNGKLNVWIFFWLYFFMLRISSTYISETLFYLIRKDCVASACTSVTPSKWSLCSPGVTVTSKVGFQFKL